MWLTKVGTPSRTELFTWATNTLKDRLHVPIWTAHEYLKHYTTSTVLEEFTTLRNEIQSFTRRTYDQLRPFIDEPLGPRARDPMTLRSDVRSALRTLDTLVESTKHWKRQYEQHAEETIQFINDHTPPESSVYEDLKSVSSYAEPRLQNTIPPGFKDLWKNHTPNRNPPSEGNDSSPPPSVYGDLLLWKEILSHARSVSATGIILLTNDRKNDWRMGKQKNQNPEHSELQKIRRSWKPVPRPHPMLAFEARTEAHIDRLEVIDCVSLAAYLHIAGVNAPAFVDVALTPDPPDVDAPRSQPSPTSSDTEPPSADPDDPRPTEQTFVDPPGVHNTLSKLRSALISSCRSPLDSDSQLILDSWIRPPEGPFAEHDIFACDPSNVDHNQLVAAARALHDGALAQKPGHSESLVDLATALDSFPPNTAAAVYFGLLASMYLNTTSKNPRFPPKSPIAKRLFQLQHAHFSRYATTVLSRHLHRRTERPLYVPSKEPRTIAFTFRAQPDRTPPGQLISMRIDTHDGLANASPVELLSPVKTLDKHHLASLLGAQADVTPQHLIHQASEIYTFPTSSVSIIGPTQETYLIPEALSFRDPRDIRIQKESNNDAD